MTKIEFCGRVPAPGIVSVGMEGEHNAETIILEGLPDIEGTATLQLILPDGTADILPITDGRAVLTRTQTQGGTLSAWAVVQDGTDVVWKSEVFRLRIGALPDIDHAAQQRFPTFVEDAVARVEAAAESVADIKNMTAQATTLEPGASATAHYEDGLLSLGIPRGTPGSGGVPSGGSTFQVLSKTSNADGAADWRDVRELPGGGGNAQQFLISDWGQTSWEYLSYIMSMSTEQGTGDKIVEIDENEIWNVYYSGRPIRLWDDTEGTDNLWTLSGLYEDHDGDGLPVFLMEYKRLKSDFTWETMKMRAASEDGSYIARIVT